MDQWRGNTQSFKDGYLKRELDTIIVANLDPTTPGNNTNGSFRLRLKNLQRFFAIQIGVSVVGVDGSPVRPNQIPVGSGNYQLTPMNTFPDTNPVWFRPLFQDPAAAINQNHPLPQDFPHSWEFATSCNEVEIDIKTVGAIFGISNLAGRLVCQATIDFLGVSTYFDIKAIQAGISKVQLTGSAPQTLGTNGG